MRLAPHGRSPRPLRAGLGRGDARRPDPTAPLPLAADAPSPRSFGQVVRIVDALPGVTAKRSSDVKDEITVEGNCINNVSRTCALTQQICAVKRKDIRKFLDGIYVSHKGNVITD